jgi:hypothetical protein
LSSPRSSPTRLTRGSSTRNIIARCDIENRIKECQLDPFADRTSAATMRANQLRLRFASFAYVLLCALRRIALEHTQFAKPNCVTIRVKPLEIGALVRVSVRRIYQSKAGSRLRLSIAAPVTARAPRSPSPRDDKAWKHVATRCLAGTSRREESRPLRESADRLASVTCWSAVI